MARPSIGEVRDRLLDAGVSVFMRSLNSNNEEQRSLASLDLKAIAAEAGYSSPGMIYTAWTDKGSDLSAREAFARDLLKRLVETSTEPDGIETDLEAVLTDGASATELVKHVSGESYRRVLHEDGWALFQALSSMPKGNEFERLLADAEDKTTRELGEEYVVALEAYGLRCKPGITGFDLSMIARALELGLSTMARLDQVQAKRFDFEWRGTEGWSLMSIAIAEILFALSEPIPTDE